MIGELFSGRVGHSLVLAWFESYVLRSVSLDSSLQLPGQRKHFGTFSVHVRLMVFELASLEKKKKEEEEKNDDQFSIFSKFVISASINLS